MSTLGEIRNAMSTLGEIREQFGIEAAIDEVERRLQDLEGCAHNPSRQEVQGCFDHDRAMELLRRLLAQLNPHGGVERVEQIGVEEAFKEAQGARKSAKIGPRWSCCTEPYKDCKCEFPGMAVAAYREGVNDGGVRRVALRTTITQIDVLTKHQYGCMKTGNNAECVRCITQTALAASK